MALDGVLHLTPCIHLWTPQDADTRHRIILCPWMGAATKHISKYVALHRQRLPTASMLILRCKLSSMIGPYAKWQKTMEPAIAPVLNLLRQCEKANVAPRILLHMFFNGGINPATLLLIDLQRTRNAALPLVGIVCDSCPGGVGYWKTYNAFTNSFAAGSPISIVASTAAHVLLAIQSFSVAMGRYENPGDLWRKAILDSMLVGCERICYVLSKADRQIDWRDVVAHASIARGRGWSVKEVVLEDTPHCHHLENNPRMYHDVVELMWVGSKLDRVKR